MSGRFGPYVKHGDINATLPRTVKTRSNHIAQAVTLIAEKAAKGPVKKRPVRRDAAKPAAKSAAKKPAQKTAKAKSKAK
jgi:DNA topoisomerase-1